MRSRTAASPSPLSLSLTPGVEIAFLTRWVGLQKPVDLFRAVKKLLYESQNCLDIPLRNIPGVPAGGWKIRLLRGGVEPRPAGPELEILGRFLVLFSTVKVSSGFCHATSEFLTSPTS